MQEAEERARRAFEAQHRAEAARRAGRGEMATPDVASAFAPRQRPPSPPSPGRSCWSSPQGGRRWQGQGVRAGSPRCTSGYTAAATTVPALQPPARPTRTGPRQARGALPEPGQTLRTVHPQTWT
eukprot:11042396-Alexandrium_andersonii.AAC.1